jgi:hypothetical protein
LIASEHKASLPLMFGFTLAAILKFDWAASERFIALLEWQNNVLLDLEATLIGIEQLLE